MRNFVPSRAAVILSPREGMPQAIAFVFMATLILAVHSILGASFGIPGFSALVVVTLLMALVSPEASFALLMVFFFLQNAFVSLVSPMIPNLEGYRLMLGSSFLNLVLTSTVCIPAWLRLRHHLPGASSELLRWMFIFLICITGYTFVGMAFVPVSNVLLYVRIYLTGALLLAVGIAFGFHLTYTYAISVVRVFAFILVAWGIAEFFLNYDFYAFFHVADYLRFKFTASGQQEAISNVMDVMNFSSRSYLNLTGNLGLNLEVLRPNGPEIHPITYAYCSVFCGLICFIYRSHILAIASLLMVLLIGAKGPMIMMFMSYLLYFIYARVSRPKVLQVCLVVSLIAYVVLGLIYGIATRDYPAIGFIGGLHGFILDPLGHGIGAGGNLSLEHQIETLADVEYWQSFGAAYGFESAFGVLLYQIGIGLVIFFIFFWKVWKNVWDAAMYYRNEPRLVIIPIALAFVFTNGVFQEEALSPAGWGIWFMISGFLLVKRWRQTSALPQPWRIKIEA